MRISKNTNKKGRNTIRKRMRDRKIRIDHFDNQVR